MEILGSDYKPTTVASNLRCLRLCLRIRLRTSNFEVMPSESQIRGIGVIEIIDPISMSCFCDIERQSQCRNRLVHASAFSKVLHIEISWYTGRALFRTCQSEHRRFGL